MCCVRCTYCDVTKKRKSSPMRAIVRLPLGQYPERDAEIRAAWRGSRNWTDPTDDHAPAPQPENWWDL